MAQIIGGITTSHVPAIGRAIARGLQQDPYWKPFFDGFIPVRKWLRESRPDVVVVVYNDHGLNFFLDRMPTFAVGAAPEYRNADEGWGIPTVPPFRGDPGLSWHLIEQLVGEEFDLTTCQEMKVDHAFTLPMALLWPDQDWPVRVVPVCINTVQAPLPSATRCWKLGQALARAVASWPVDERVLVLGTGGLSHQLDGELPHPHQQHGFGPDAAAAGLKARAGSATLLGAGLRSASLAVSHSRQAGMRLDAGDGVHRGAPFPGLDVFCPRRAGDPRCSHAASAPSTSRPSPWAA